VRRDVPFLGGPVSAALVYLAMQDGGGPLAWFALVPLLHSAARHQRNGRMRSLHGVSFGLLAAASLLAWIPRGHAWPWWAIAAAVHAALGWAFAWGAGFLYRGGRTWAPLVAVPILWTGLEVLRGPLAPIHVPWACDWLGLGYAFAPDSAEGQAAAVAGVHGLSFAACAASTAFSLVFRARSFARQLALCALGCAAPLAIAAYGAGVLPHEASRGSDPVAVVASAAVDPAKLMSLTRDQLPQGPKVVVWPGFGVQGTHAAPIPPEVLAACARELRAPIIAGDSVAQPTGAEPGSPLRGEIVVGLEHAFDSPAPARVGAAAGASLLAVVTSDGDGWSERGISVHARMHRFRAVENRRWLVRSGRALAFISDPFGRMTLQLAGVEAAGGEDVEMLAERSIYSRFGWWIEPASVFVAMVMLCCGAASALGAQGRTTTRMSPDSARRASTDSQGQGS
jgi:apolipoprotein N-acyltransferase